MSNPTKGIGPLDEKSGLMSNTGTNYLLAIAIDEYAHLPPLFNPVRDANTFIELMTERYRFEEENVTRIFNSEATEPRIYGAFREFIEKIKPDDSLVVYYSGHGEFDKVLDEGYWIPVNAHQGAFNEYIGNDVIRRFISRINSKHTFLVSDSCFAGSLFASGASKNVSKRYERDPSRWGLTAGRKEIVSDGKPGMHSPFADALLYRLRTSSEPLGVQELCSYVVEQVEANANQSPIGEPLKVDGHKNGQFVFHLKKDEARDWGEAVAAGTGDAFRRFLTMYPAGVNTEEALWKIAQVDDNLYGYLEYLNAHPRGAYQRQAEKRLAQLEDERDWDETSRINTILAYRKYKQSHPKGSYLEEADKRINILLGGGKPAAPRKKTTYSAPPPPKKTQTTSPPPQRPSATLSTSSSSWSPQKLALVIGLPAVVVIALIIWAVSGSGSSKTGWDCAAEFDQCKTIIGDKQTYFLVRDGDNWGAYDEKGNKLISPQYQALEPFAENGLALAKYKNKFGWINWEGKEVIPFEYDRGESFKADTVLVVQGGRAFYIDARGKERKYASQGNESSGGENQGSEYKYPASKDLSSILLRISSGWNSLWNRADLSYKGCWSYIPDIGIRGRYAAAKSALNPAILGKLVGEPVYLSGPHSGADLNLGSNTEFGHYNPEFLRKLGLILKDITRNKKLVKELQPFYDAHLKDYLRIHLFAYPKFAKNKELMRKYVEYVRKGESGASFYPFRDELSAFTNEMKKRNIGDDVGHIAYSVPSFWVRRTLDRTQDDFFELLTIIVETFDPQYAPKG